MSHYSTRSIRYSSRISQSLVALCLIIGMIFGGQIATIGQAIDLSFDSFSPSFGSRFAPLQFVGGGNSYAGGIFITSTEQLSSPQTVVFANQTLICQKKLDGYYMSTARGLRLRPLGQSSLTNLRGADSSYNTITLEWGLYTACIGHPQDIVGYVKHNSGYFPGWSAYIIAGSTLSVPTNSFTNNYQSGSFSADSFRYLNGSIYDTVVGIGTVSGTGLENDQIGNLFFNGLAVLGRVGLTRTINETERTALQGNVGIGSTIYGGQDITSSTTFNTINKNVNTLCRGSNNVDSLQNIPVWQKIICLSQGADDTITINDPTLADKDIIIKQWHVFVDKSMNGHPLKLFVMKGNLIIDSSVWISDLSDFTSDGFATTDPSRVVSQWLSLDGIYMVNGLIIWSPDGWATLRPIVVKTYLHGKLASLNLPTSTPSIQRELQVTSLFGTTDYNQFINLQNVFTRQCNPLTGRGIGATGSVATSIDCDDIDDLFAQNSLIVIEKDVSSVLLRG